LLIEDEAGSRSLLELSKRADASMTDVARMTGRISQMEGTIKEVTAERELIRGPLNNERCLPNTVKDKTTQLERILDIQNGVVNSRIAQFDS
jgi:hypothetical protein